MMPELIRAVEYMGWVLPTPVQAEAMPLILGGGDVMAVSPRCMPKPPPTACKAAWLGIHPCR